MICSVTSQISLDPFIYYLHLAIGLGMIVGTRCNWDLVSLNNSYQKVVMNLVSLSLTIFQGSPCKWNTSLKNKSTTCRAIYVWEIEKKCAKLINRSSTTKMSFLLLTWVKQVMKSMEIDSHKDAILTSYLRKASIEVNGDWFPFLFWNRQRSKKFC